ncbi:MAG TPA: adenylate/guanylate cyclase domain-containing protein [Acidimicrobiales bacterium]|nr:adenylate/guanylate cyclase domain-containing protein [Acidimicrobiales bacterium]
MAVSRRRGLTSAPRTPDRGDELTLLFTDIQGSTQTLARLGEATYAGLLGLHHAAIRGAVVRNRGTERGTEGDSFFVTFPDPVAGVVAAVEAQRAIARTVWPDGVAVKVRMGLHTGPVAQTGGNLVGMAIHTAARIKSAAHGGQIVVSEATATGCRAAPDLTFKDLGHHRLRDIAGRVGLLQVLHRDLNVEFPPLTTEPSDFIAVPRSLSATIGRGAERKMIERLLAEHRMVTLTGGPGVGKTRLATAVTADRSGDAAFADLGSVDDSTEAGARIVAALGVTMDGDGDPGEAIVRHIGKTPVLLVADGCEHAIDEVAALVSKLTTRCEALRVLATSREALALDGEVTVTIGPLAEAEDLFVSRARAANPLIAFSPDDELVVALCERLDRLPLAIELAATHVRSLPLPELLERLDEQLSILKSSRRDVPARHRSLQAAVEWSVRSLGDPERAALRRLSVIRNPFDLRAAEAVSDQPAEAILALCDRSLLARGDDPQAGQLRMLGTVRAFADRALHAADEVELASRAHAHAFAARARAARTVKRDEAALEGLIRDADNHLVAVRWLTANEPVKALSMALDLEGLWTAHLPGSVGAQLLDTVIEGAPDAPPAERAAALVLAAEVYRNAGRIAAARRAAETVVAMDDPAAGGAMPAPVMLGQILAMQGALDDSQALFESALRSGSARGDQAYVVMALREIANLAIERQRPDEALAPLEEATALASLHEEARWMLTPLAVDFGRAALALGRVAEARAAYEWSIARAQHLGIARAIAGCSLGLAAVARHEGMPSNARPFLREAVRINRDHGDLAGLAHCFIEGAMLHSAENHDDVAVRLIGGASATRNRLGIATPGSETAGIDVVIQRAVQGLSEGRVDQLLAAGRGATMDELVTQLG